MAQPFSINITIQKMNENEDRIVKVDHLKAEPEQWNIRVNS